MENPKCPRCGGPSDNFGGESGLTCENDKCRCQFFNCPFCQDLIYSYHPEDSTYFDSCPHLVVRDDPNWGPEWYIESEEKAFNDWLEKKRQQQIDEEKLPFLEEERLKKEEWEKEREQALQDGEDPEDWEEYWDEGEWTADDDERAGEIDLDEAFEEYVEARGFIRSYISWGTRHDTISHTFYFLEDLPTEK